MEPVLTSLGATDAIAFRASQVENVIGTSLNAEAVPVKIAAGVLTKSMDTHVLVRQVSQELIARMVGVDDRLKFCSQIIKFKDMI